MMQGKATYIQNRKWLIPGFWLLLFLIIYSNFIITHVKLKINLFYCEKQYRAVWCVCSNLSEANDVLVKV